MQDILNSNIVKGDELWLFIGKHTDGADPSANTEFKPIAFSQTHSMSNSMSTQTISSKYHANTSYVIPGEKSWTVSTEALMSMFGTEDETNNTDTIDLAFFELNDLYNESKLVDVCFGKLKAEGESYGYNPEGVVENDVDLWQIDDTKALYGVGYITSLSANGSHGDSATMSIEITGIGLLKKKSNPEPPAGEYTITHVPSSGESEENKTLLLSNLTVSPTTAAEGDDVTVTPSGYQYYPEYVTLSTTPTIQDLAWDSSDHRWEFETPNQNVTVTSQFKTKFNIVKTGDWTSYIGVKDDHQTVVDALPAGVILSVYPNDPSQINGTSYTCTINTSGGSYIAYATWDGHSYWSTPMPSQDIQVDVS